MSQRKGFLCSLLSKPVLKGSAVAATVLALLMLFYLPATAAVTYEISDGENTYRIESNESDVSEVLDEAGIEHSDIDLIQTSEEDEVVSVSITRRQYVTVVCDDVSTSMLIHTGDTVADVLEHMNIQLGEYDQISMDLTETPIHMKELMFAKVKKCSEQDKAEAFRIAAVFSVEVADIGPDSVLFECKLTERRNNELIRLLKDRFESLEIVRGGAVAIESVSTSCR